MNLRRFRRPLYKLARRYISYRDGNPYDFARNGERLLLTRIAVMRPRMILDVGANVGNWSAAAHEIMPGATLHAFELSSANFDQLAAQFSGEDRVHTHPFGLGNRNEEIVYKDYGKGSGPNTILTQSDFHDKRTPPCCEKEKYVAGRTFARRQTSQRSTCSRSMSKALRIRCSRAWGSYSRKRESGSSNSSMATPTPTFPS